MCEKNKINTDERNEILRGCDKFNDLTKKN